MASEDEILNEREAAQLLKVSTRTLYDLRRQRALPFKLVGKQVRYLRSELLYWMSGGRVPGVAA